MLRLGAHTYLTYLLACTLPVIAVQVALVWRWHGLGCVRRLSVPVLAVSAWLTFADHFAIAAGVWRFDDTRILGVRLGVVPLEEALFFILTNLLVALGMALFQRRT